MLSICEEFSKTYYIKYNSKKIICIQYSENIDEYEKTQLNKETIIILYVSATRTCSTSKRGIFIPNNQIRNGLLRSNSERIK